MRWRSVKINKTVNCMTVACDGSVNCGDGNVAYLIGIEPIDGKPFTIIGFAGGGEITSPDSLDVVRNQFAE